MQIELIIALVLVALFAVWVFLLKRQIAELTDRVAIMEAEREKKRGGQKSVVDKPEARKAGIQTYELE